MIPRQENSLANRAERKTYWARGYWLSAAL
jgi:hypothetical protein